MQRRLHRFFLGMLACGAWLAPATGEAALSCSATERAGVEHCQAGLDADAALQIHQTQRASEWCWAASIAMLLRHHGVSVAQEDVVRAHWGSATNLGVSMADVSRLLHRTWRDPAGRAYPAPGGGLRALGPAERRPPFLTRVGPGGEEMELAALRVVSGASAASR